MEYKIRPVESGDALALAHIQTESWKAAFAKLLPEEVLRSATHRFRPQSGCTASCWQSSSGMG